MRNTWWKRMSVLMVTIFILSLLAGCGGGQQSSDSGGQGTPEDPIVIKLAHDHMTTSPFQESAEIFAELIEERSEGRMIVEIYPAQQLGSSREMIEGMQIGSIEMTLLPTAKFGGFDQKLTLVDMPFLFPNEDVLWKVLDGEIGDEMMSGLESIGIKGLSFYAEGFKAFTANKEIHNPEDFKGMKFRTMEAPVIMAQYEAWGANPVPVDFSEVYNSLQQKVVDGQENPLLSIHDMKFYEVQDYMIMGDHGYLSYFMSASKKWYDGLPDDLRQIVYDVTREVAQSHKGLMEEANKIYLENITNYGTTVYELTQAEKDAFFQASQSVYDQFRDAIGADLMDKTLKFIEENK